MKSNNQSSLLQQQQQQQNQLTHYKKGGDQSLSAQAAHQLLPSKTTQPSHSPTKKQSSKQSTVQTLVYLDDHHPHHHHQTSSSLKNNQISTTSNKRNNPQFGLHATTSQQSKQSQLNVVGSSSKQSPQRNFQVQGHAQGTSESIASHSHNYHSIHSRGSDGGQIQAQNQKIGNSGGSSLYAKLTEAYQQDSNNQHTSGKQGTSQGKKVSIYGGLGGSTKKNSSRQNSNYFNNQLHSQGQGNSGQTKVGSSGNQNSTSTKQGKKGNSLSTTKVIHVNFHDPSSQQIHSQSYLNQKGNLQHNNSSLNKSHISEDQNLIQRDSSVELEHQISTNDAVQQLEVKSIGLNDESQDMITGLNQKNKKNQKRNTLSNIGNDGRQQQDYTNNQLLIQGGAGADVKSTNDLLLQHQQNQPLNQQSMLFMQLNNQSIHTAQNNTVQSSNNASRSMSQRHKSMHKTIQPRQKQVSNNNIHQNQQQQQQNQQQNQQQLNTSSTNHDLSLLSQSQIQNNNQHIQGQDGSVLALQNQQSDISQPQQQQQTVSRKIIVNTNNTSGIILHHHHGVSQQVHQNNHTTNSTNNSHSRKRNEINSNNQNSSFLSFSKASKNQAQSSTLQQNKHNMSTKVNSSSKAQVNKTLPPHHHNSSTLNVTHKTPKGGQVHAMGMSSGGTNSLTKDSNTRQSKHTKYTASHHHHHHGHQSNYLRHHTQMNTASSHSPSKFKKYGGSNLKAGNLGSASSYQISKYTGNNVPNVRSKKDYLLTSSNQSHYQYLYQGQSSSQTRFNKPRQSKGDESQKQSSQQVNNLTSIRETSSHSRTKEKLGNSQKHTHQSYSPAKKTIQYLSSNVKHHLVQNDNTKSPSNQYLQGVSTQTGGQTGVMSSSKNHYQPILKNKKQTNQTMLINTTQSNTQTQDVFQSTERQQITQTQVNSTQSNSIVQTSTQNTKQHQVKVLVHQTSSISPTKKSGVGSHIVQSYPMVKQTGSNVQGQMGEKKHQATGSQIPATREGAKVASNALFNKKSSKEQLQMTMDDINSGTQSQYNKVGNTETVIGKKRDSSGNHPSVEIMDYEINKSFQQALKTAQDILLTKGKQNTASNLNIQENSQSQSDQNKGYSTQPQQKQVQQPQYGDDVISNGSSLGTNQHQQPNVGNQTQTALQILEQQQKSWEQMNYGQSNSLVPSQKVFEHKGDHTLQNSSVAEDDEDSVRQNQDKLFSNDNDDLEVIDSFQQKTHQDHTKSFAVASAVNKNIPITTKLQNFQLQSQQSQAGASLSNKEANFQSFTQKHNINNSSINMLNKEEDQTFQQEEHLNNLFYANKQQSLLVQPLDSQRSHSKDNNQEKLTSSQTLFQFQGQSIVSENNKKVGNTTFPYQVDDYLEQFEKYLYPFEVNEISKLKNNGAQDSIYYHGKIAVNRRSQNDIGSPAVKILRESVIQESFDDKEGYYRVKVGDHINYRYQILRVLGKGSFAQVVQCIDHKLKQEVAIKITRNTELDHKFAEKEYQLLQFLMENDPEDSHKIVRMLDEVKFRNHHCFVFELLHYDLFEHLKSTDFKGFTVNQIRDYAVQILQALKFLEEKNLIHCDLKPENILLVDKQCQKLKVVDFGSGCFQEKQVYTYVQSRFYRSPEVIMRIPYTNKVDIWSLGCILAELYTGEPIFPGNNEQEQLEYIMELMGIPPDHVIDQSRKKDYYFDTDYSPFLIEDPEEGILRIPEARAIEEAIPVDSNDFLFLDFIQKCLDLDPKARMSAKEASQHPWILQASANQSQQDKQQQLQQPTILYRQRDHDGAKEHIYEESPERPILQNNQKLSLNQVLQIQKVQSQTSRQAIQTPSSSKQMLNSQRSNKNQQSYYAGDSFRNAQGMDNQQQIFSLASSVLQHQEESNIVDIKNHSKFQGSNVGTAQQRASQGTTQGKNSLASTQQDPLNKILSTDFKNKYVKYLDKDPSNQQQAVGSSLKSSQEIMSQFLVHNPSGSSVPLTKQSSSLSKQQPSLIKKHSK